MTMTGIGPFDLSIIIPSGYVGPMQYYFSVQDVGDHWVSTGISSVTITDNDAPVINTVFITFSILVCYSILTAGV